MHDILDIEILFYKKIYYKFKIKMLLHMSNMSCPNFIVYSQFTSLHNLEEKNTKKKLFLGHFACMKLVCQAGLGLQIRIRMLF